MLAYYVAYCIMLAAAVFLTQRKIQYPGTAKKYQTLYCTIFAVIWILLLGLRHPSMGVDIGYGNPHGYWAAFTYIGERPWVEVLFQPYKNYEIGYRFFSKFFHLFSKNPQFLLFIVAAVSIGLVSNLISENSRFPFLSTVIYLGLTCFLMNFSGVRQVLAIAITAYSYRYIRDRKLLKFILCVFIAATFHRTAALFLVAYPIYAIRLSRKMSILSMLMIPIVYILRRPLFLILSRLIYENVSIRETSAVTLFLVFTAVYVFCVLFGHDSDREEMGLRNIFFVACLCQAFSGVFTTAMRVGYYFMLYLTLLLPRVIFNCRKEAKNSPDISTSVMYIGILMCFGMFGLHLISGGSWAMSNPYHFFWQ